MIWVKPAYGLAVLGDKYGGLTSHLNHGGRVTVPLRRKPLKLGFQQCGRVLNTLDTTDLADDYLGEFHERISFSDGNGRPIDRRRRLFQRLHE